MNGRDVPGGPPLPPDGASGDRDDQVEDLVDDPGQRPDPADEALMARLAQMFAQEDAPPAIAVELARQSFGLRSVDDELAALVADSEVEGTAAAVRRAGTGAPRLLTFECADLLVEVEISGPDARGRFLAVGQLVPPTTATIEVRQLGVDERRTVEADDQGRFLVDDLPAGVTSLRCLCIGRAPVITDWTLIG